MISAESIVKLHKDRTESWHSDSVAVTSKDFMELVETNHSFNFQLWHEEDKARREDCGFEYVYHAKRNIDGFNQRRNNMIETMDEWIFHHYSPAQNDCPVNSETPGMMIDRLSILALKAYHMQEQVDREDASAEHSATCQKKVAVIVQQRDQLKTCLAELLDDIQAKTRTFRVYHQFKMYNDPSLNPQLYRKETHEPT